MDGEGAKAPSRLVKNKPEGAETQEGIGRRRELNARVLATDPRSEQGPEDGRAFLASTRFTASNRGEAQRQGMFVNGTRATVGDEPARLTEGATP